MASKSAAISVNVIADAAKFKAGLKESFNDYVPPHKNLGAIFIMAYQKKINQP